MNSQISFAKFVCHSRSLLQEYYCARVKMESRLGNECFSHEMVQPVYQKGLSPCIISVPLPAPMSIGTALFKKKSCLCEKGSHPLPSRKWKK